MCYGSVESAERVDTECRETQIFEYPDSRPCRSEFRCASCVGSALRRGCGRHLEVLFPQRQYLRGINNAMWYRIGELWRNVGSRRFQLCGEAPVANTGISNPYMANRTNGTWKRLQYSFLGAVNAVADQPLGGSGYARTWTYAGWNVDTNQYPPGQYHHACINKAGTLVNVQCSYKRG